MRIRDPQPQMTVDHERRNQTIFKALWEKGSSTYESHPTSRHRRRFALKSLAGESLSGESFVFDYGCGSGVLLEHAAVRYGLPEHRLAGCDITESAIQLARTRLNTDYLYVGKFPELEIPCNVIFCTEVIEHTPDYRAILEWTYAHLAPGGLLVLTTPGTPMDPPDVEYGHVQHFDLPPLVTDLEKIGFAIETARRWGFPFFTVQKFITKLFYQQIRKHVIESDMGILKRTVFELLYRVYFVHDFIPAGPQILIRARKPEQA